MNTLAASSLKCAVWLLALMVFVLLSAGLTRAQSANNILPDGDAKDVVATACTQCHSLKLIVVFRDGTVGWKEMVDNMILRGAQVRPAEVQPIIS
jgi:hypothetical protein